MRLLKQGAAYRFRKYKQAPGEMVRGTRAAGGNVFPGVTK